MIIPENKRSRDEFLKWVLDTCTNSKRDRKDLYERRRRFFLFGSDAEDSDLIYNRIESHLDLVSSFLYASDNANFSLSAPLNSPDNIVKQFAAAQDAFNSDFRDAGLFDFFGDAIGGSLVFDSELLKIGWSKSRSEKTCTLIEPWKFGVFSEESTDLDSQEAFSYSYHIDYSNAVQRLERGGLSEHIKKLDVTNTPFESPYPELITRMIISSTAGTDLSGNITGSVNPAYVSRPSYRAKVERPLVEFHELTVWDTELDDYRTFFMVQPDLVISDSKETVEALKRTGEFSAKRKRKGGVPEISAELAEQLEPLYNTACNLFLPKEHPYVQVRPYQVHEYFWGKAHIDSLIPLQKWSNERLDQIHDILEKQADPARVLSGFSGLPDDKAAALGGAGTWVLDQMPQAQVKTLAPEMPPDIFADYNQIGALFLEASGLTEVMQGKGEAGVRSRGHAKQLATTGGGRIKKAATRLEASLVRLGDLALKVNMRENDEPIVPDPKEDGSPGDPFFYAHLVGNYALRIAGHSHSPLFADDTKELVGALFKAQAIDQEQMLRLLNPPNRDMLIHALRVRQKKAAQAAALRQKMGLSEPGSGGRGRKGGNNLAQSAGTA